MIAFEQLSRMHALKFLLHFQIVISLWPSSPGLIKLAKSCWYSKAFATVRQQEQCCFKGEQCSTAIVVPSGEKTISR